MNMQPFFTVSTYTGGFRYEETNSEDTVFARFGCCHCEHVCRPRARADSGEILSNIGRNIVGVWVEVDSGQSGWAWMEENHTMWTDGTTIRKASVIVSTLGSVALHRQPPTTGR